MIPEADGVRQKRHSTGWRPSSTGNSMIEEQPLRNRVRDHRLARGWSQQDLAIRAGVSRAGISAIEQGRLVPSAATALILATVFDCRVEDIFALAGELSNQPMWAWQPLGNSSRYWRAVVACKELLYPVEPTNLGTVPHDGVLERGGVLERCSSVPINTLVMASCDPAAGLLASELQRSHGIRLIAFQRPSRTALTLLAQGLIHVAGVHLDAGGQPSRNITVASATLQCGLAMLRVARWQEGLALASDLRIKSIEAALKSKLRWVGRESGSAVRELLDELLAGRAAPRRIAYSHRGVAEAVRCGWANAGVCLRLVCEEAGLGFVGIRQENYDLCFPLAYESDPRIQALVDVVRSASYRRALAEIPGYDTTTTGELHRVS
ncbi:MAG: helix-turn-helix domain-containing protein [Pirellulales bacterium]|nr:helix-turn-helix domain-containing protein [Pirellulales bacterium]